MSLRERIQDFDDEKLLLHLSESSDSSAKKLYLQEGLSRFIFEAENNTLLRHTLDGLFSHPHKEDVYENMELLREVVVENDFFFPEQTTTDSIEQMYDSMDMAFESLSLNYFNVVSEEHYQMKQGLMVQGFMLAKYPGRSFSKRSLSYSMAAVASLDQPELFADLINAHTDHYPYVFEELSDLAVQADYAKNNLFLYHDDELFLPGVTQQMLYRSSVRDQIGL